MDLQNFHRDSIYLYMEQCIIFLYIHIVLYSDIPLPWWHASAPICKINYVNMQHEYVHLRLIYVTMQQKYVDIQHNYDYMRDNYVDMLRKLCYMSTSLSCMVT